ncbi:MAG: glycosyltransferase family 4 protein [Lachnospiraceae bacterium]|nr:glycosyltransferase family 4 protein [Lachnospiraceae bacterium]
MNILFVTGLFAKDEKDTALSGMPNAVYKSAIGMQKREHRVQILTVANKDARWHYRGLKVISIQAKHGLEEKNILRSMFLILKREYKIKKTIQLLHKEKPIDIIQYTGWFGIGLLHSLDIPAVMRISSYTKVQLTDNFDKGKRYLLETAECLAAKRMNCVFAPSRIMASGAEKDIKKKVYVIETPFLQEEVEWDDKILRTELKNKRYVLFFGRMSVDKGILVIRDVMYRILQKYPDICFVFAGNSWKHNGVVIEEELMQASREYKDRVIFPGLLSKNLLMPVISNAEVVLMPSLADNFPNACAEAMALGKIVIGTDGSSLEQFIIDGKSGYLAKIGNADSLFSCLEHVLNMDVMQKRDISQNAMERIRKLDVERYSATMEMLYNKVIAK